MGTRDASGDLTYKLSGPDSLIWGTSLEPHERTEDLISTLHLNEEDPFSQFLLETVMQKFFDCHGHRKRKADKVSGEVLYRRSKILRVTYYITTALASSLLVLSIVVLWHVNSMTTRLMLVAIFNMLLSACVAMFTTAPRAGIFGITAGFVPYNRMFDLFANT